MNIPRPQIPVKQVNAIVVHYVGNPGTSAAANRSYFEGLAVSGETYASANFVVGLDGEILQCVPRQRSGLLFQRPELRHCFH